jgi:dTDP-glucose 4,6-dehydratase
VVRQVLAPRRDESLIRYVDGPAGHDRRYALSSARLMRETGWKPRVDFEAGLARTIEWYRQNPGWTGRVRSGEYRAYYERNYGGRTALDHARGD